MGDVRKARVRAWGGLGCVAVVCLCAAARPLTAWERALADRDAFEAASDKSRPGFTRVMDEFRAVYHENPAAAHAPDAVYAVAALLAEQGRMLGDRKSLRAAIGQYEFLRAQYPASSLRGRALLAEAEIEQQDLGESDVARETYQAVVREAPRSAAAGEARSALAGLGSAASAPQASAPNQTPAHPAAGTRRQRPGPDRGERKARRNPGGRRNDEPGPGREPGARHGSGQSGEPGAGAYPGQAMPRMAAAPAPPRWSPASGTGRPPRIPA